MQGCFSKRLAFLAMTLIQRETLIHKKCQLKDSESLISEETRLGRRALTDLCHAMFNLFLISQEWALLQQLEKGKRPNRLNHIPF